MANQASTPLRSPQPMPAATAAPSRSPGLSRGMRETIESIAIAFALAFLFKAFEAEAFVIPTGSMAPTLMGRHKDVVCPQCGYRYSASASDEANRDGSEKLDPAWDVVSCTCPICRFPMSVDPRDPENPDRAALRSYSGDRIWVSKVPYHLMEPRRWDVIVFRFPEEAETYYIKRLVGLPNETVQIHHGDIYTQGPNDPDFVLQRKPPDKVRAMAQIVHDNDYLSTELQEHGWPPRWQLWSEEGEAGTWKAADDKHAYRTDGTAKAETWIRYQHLVPGDENWLDGRWSDAPQPQLITDFYAFNTRLLRRAVENGRGPDASSLGLHWVGDLLLDCEVDVQGTGGTLLLDLVKAGHHFRCSIDVASGKAELAIDGLSDYRPTATTSVHGAGSYRLMFANADRQLILWVNDKVVAFDTPTLYDELGDDRPQAGGADGGDLAPVGIGSRGLSAEVKHLRVLRDIYYIAESVPTDPLTDFRKAGLFWGMNNEQVAAFFATPSQWMMPQGGSVFDKREPVRFPLAANQFFVLGDNSPASSDARLWSIQHYVERDLLIGKALFVYWPHPLNLPIPFTDVSLGVIPNFTRMGFIR